MLFAEWRTKEKITRFNTVVSGSHYDENYFSGKTSNWTTNYDEQNFGALFRKIAHFIVEGFVTANSYLDVGCAKGFLVANMMEISRINKIEFDVEGFDISRYAIENCHPNAKGKVSCSSVDEYEFVRSFDMMIALDVFEHLTEEQIRSWLTRSRPFINDSIFAQIPLENSFGAYDDKSHVTIKTRQWWNDLFHECGWVTTRASKKQTELAMGDHLPKSIGWEVFIFRSNADYAFSE